MALITQKSIFTALFALALLLMLNISAAQPKIVNSGDWKDTLSAATFFDGEKFLVRNPGEAEQAASRYNSSALVLESKTDPGFSGLESKLGSRKVKFSYKDVYRNSSELEKIYIVNPHFASEALTVLPEAVKSGKALTFYSQEEVDKIDSEVKTVFVGFYPKASKPDSDDFISSKDPLRLNREFVKSQYNGGAVVLTDSGSPGFQSLLTGEPILLKGGPEKDAELLEQIGADTIKVIGSENTGYARQLGSLASHELSIAVKVGRAVADSSDAEIYGVKSVTADTRENRLRLKDAIYDQSTGKMRVFVENVYSDSYIELENFKVQQGEEETSYGSGHGFYLDKGETVSLIKELDQGMVPTRLELQGALNGEDWLNSTEVEISNFQEENIEVEARGEELHLTEPADQVYISQRGSTRTLEKIDPETFKLPENIDDGLKISIYSDGKVYLEEVSANQEGYNQSVYLAAFSGVLLICFFSFVIYRELSDAL